MTRLTLQPAGVVAGGAAIARDDDGRVVFVVGAIPGERVVAEVTEEHRDFRRAAVVDVVDPSPDRIAPPCGNVALGCGGCGWQHVAVPAQRSLKEAIVADALTRIGKVAGDDVPPIETVALPTAAFRTTVRVAVRDGRARFHAARSVDLVRASGCMVAHPLVADVLDHGHFGAAAAEATVRAAVATGERAVLVRPAAPDARLPADVAIGGAVHERIEGRTLRVSIRSFFQASPQAAAALVREVVASIDAAAIEPTAVADLYAGVGLFADAVASRYDDVRVVAVERSRSAATDARHNLAYAGHRARVVGSEVGRWRPDRRFDVVIADPARPGLARPGVAAVRAAAADALVLVSCDAASFGRDVALLRAAGFGLRRVRLVDAYPHTPHVEVTSLFERSTRRA